ncbi:Acetyltransferase (GNAT) family protein [Nocardioides scoriae]|uniref:Acetyltransferase (GNAT) family protein n=1 Tax=Nocardioides scoriae TaxID=642780 RepID=A0A1H1XQW0_9ACTN|nr:GNAT family N-acetyltransferase [Nocardioides scoriae]SDT11618.1 Acetyltransferase (GNAT) family protein [Nocardioides scoriae]
MTQPGTGEPDGLAWVREPEPVWDADKRRVIGGAPAGAFVLPFQDGDALPGEWWSAREGGTHGEVLGYGRLDVSWGGDAEVLLAVDPARQRGGVGSFVLASLEEEASARGLNYVYNTIREHDQREQVHDWLVVRGFRGSADGDLRKRVLADAGRAAPGGSSRARPGPSRSVGHDDATAADTSAGSSTGSPTGSSTGDRGPGHEESGGYVDVDEHQY